MARRFQFIALALVRRVSALFQLVAFRISLIPYIARR